MIVNFSQRAHNHTWSLDPIVRSLLDTDFYKLLMLQFIWRNFAALPVKFQLKNRTRTVQLAEQIDEAALRQQLDHVRSLRFRKSELIWLGGNSFYGIRNIFEPAFLTFLADWQPPEYRLERQGDHWDLSFSGAWADVTLWETYALSIVSELRTRHGLQALSEFKLDILYARAKALLWSKIERLRGVPGLRFADFGTRRRHSFLWHEYVVQALQAELPREFVGTSNAFLAYKHDLEAIGTNAHELPMALAAIATSDEERRQAQYRILELWQQNYGGELRILLPDAYGTDQFLAGAPDWVADWRGARGDSKDPYVNGDQIIDFFQSHGRDPATKLFIPSDGLDVDQVLGLHAYFGGIIQPGHTPDSFRSAADFTDPAKWLQQRRIQVSAGWGTLLTNDFRGCHPDGSADFLPASLVCKLVEAGGRPAVKLSDNYLKSTGPTEEIEAYRRLFGTAGIENLPVEV
jgi:nicotinate phosphoribosyltransferase